MGYGAEPWAKVCARQCEDSQAQIFLFATEMNRMRSNLSMLSLTIKLSSRKKHMNGHIFTFFLNLYDMIGMLQYYVNAVNYEQLVETQTCRYAGIF